MEFAILGPLEVREGERTIALGSAQQRTVLAALLLAANQPVPADRLAEALWGDKPPASADAVIKNRISQLRKILGQTELRTEPSGYLLRIDPDELDVQRFTRLAREGHEELAAGHADRAASALSEALALWRGPALADFAYADFAQAEIGRLEELRLATTEDRIEADLACGRAAELVPELEALCQEHPLRERLRGLLMLALYRSGRQAEALAAYQASREALIEGLGIEPGPELRELNRLILNQDASLATPVVRPLIAAPSLPVQPTPLIGREDELREVVGLLRSSRLLALTGPGGIGKTRLALQAAAELAEEVPDGVWFVALAPLTDAELIEPTIAGVVGARGDLLEHLAGKQILLLLDNVEQLLPAAAPRIAALLAAPGVKVLLTSRERLAVAAEREYPVPSLPLDEAVELFTERARRIEPRFQPDGHVAEICRRLDGLPLAIELASARTKLLPPQALLERLEARLPLLVGGARDLPERQQTLRATIDWSYQLLERDEQRLFARLAVFAGGCTLDAAEAICGEGGEALDVIASLLDKSLLRRPESEAEPRLSMLQTIREYALERLAESGEADELARRHAEYFLRLVEEAEPELEDVGLTTALARLRPEEDNFRAAVAWCLDRREAELGQRLVGVLASFWILRGDVSWGSDLARDLLPAGEDGAPAARAYALNAAARLEHIRGDYSRAERYWLESLELYRELGMSERVQIVLGNVGAWKLELGDLEGAAQVLTESLELAREVGDERGVAFALHNLGEVEALRGRHDEALRCYERSLELLEQLGDRDRIAASFVAVAHAAVATGDLEEASAALTRGLELFRELRVKVPEVGDALVLLGALLAERGDPICAARMVGAAETLARASGWGSGRLVKPLAERTHERLTAELEPSALAEESCRGAALTLEEALDFALETLERPGD